MRIDEFAPYVRTAQETARRRALYRMTDCLLLTFRIPPHERTLGPLLLGRPAGDNREALAQWIRQQLAEPDTVLGEAVLPILSDMLGHRLSDLHTEDFQ